jgi:hypothetical protein
MKKQRESETNVNRTDGKASNDRAVEQTCACAWISSLLIYDAKEEEEES